MTRSSCLQWSNPCTPSRKHKVEPAKKLSSSDEAALHSAEQILNEEFALALHMQPGEIPLLVQQALHTTSRAES